MVYDLYIYSANGGFSANGGVVIQWQQFDAADDEAVIARPSELSDQAPREIWRDQLLVKRWEAPADCR